MTDNIAVCICTRRDAETIMLNPNCPVHSPRDFYTKEEIEKMRFKERKGSQDYYKLLDEMAELHERKHHDYANDENPTGNYHFAGKVANLFAHSAEDAGFVGRLAEKIYRLATLEGGRKQPLNESIDDTERDIAVIACLWIADRRKRRGKLVDDKGNVEEKTIGPTPYEHFTPPKVGFSSHQMAKCALCGEYHMGDKSCATKPAGQNQKS